MQNVSMNKNTNPSKMSKQQLVAAVCEATGRPEKVVRHVLDAATAVIISELCDGRIPYGLGLGKFSVVRRPEKPGRDIRRGTAVVVPERNAVIFRPSLTLTAAVNGRSEE